MSRRIALFLVPFVIATTLVFAAPMPAANAGAAAPVAIPGAGPGHLAVDDAHAQIFVSAGDRYLALRTDGTVLREYPGKNSGSDVAVIGNVAYVLEPDTGSIARIDTATLEELAPFSTGVHGRSWMVAVAGGLWVSASTDSAGVGARVDLATGALTVWDGLVIAASDSSKMSVAGNFLLDAARGDVWNLSGPAPTHVRHLVDAVTAQPAAIAPDGQTIYTQGRSLEIIEWSVATAAPTGRTIPYSSSYTTKLVVSDGDGGSLFRASAGNPLVSRFARSTLAPVWVEQRSSYANDMAVAANGVDAFALTQRDDGSGVALHLLPSPPPPPPPIGPGGYHPVSPGRVLDTREGAGALGPGGELRIKVTGVAGVPSTRVAAVVMNVTATEPTAGGYVTVWPAGRARPTASSLNFGPGQTVPNLVTSGVGPNGDIAMFNEAGNVHLVADIVGWYDQGYEGVSGIYERSEPVRVLDTRGDGSWYYEIDGTPNISAAGRRPPEPLHANQRLTVRTQQTAGATAAIVNITVVNPTTSGYLTVYPTGEARPTASNLNFVAGQVRSNLAIVGLAYGSSASMKGFDIVSPYGDVDVVVDLLGWFRPHYASGAVPESISGKFSPLTPTRVLDTRLSNSHLSDHEAGTFRFPTEFAGAKVMAYALNVTVTGTTQPSFLSMWPGNGQPLPGSVLNWVAGETVPNQVIMAIASDGTVYFYNHGGRADVIVDVVGVYWA